MNYSPFFIIGSKRGGTTLLRLMLNKHTQIAVPHESHFIIPLVKRFHPQESLSKAQLTEAGDIILNHSRFHTWHISKNDIESIIESLPVPCSLEKLITAVFEKQVQPTGKKYWGEKTPEYIDIIPQLKQLYPGAKFIALCRDGRDVSASLKERGWEGWTVYQRATYWKNCMYKMNTLMTGDADSLCIQYEELVLNQSAVLARVTNFLGLPFEPGMLDFNEDYQANITSVEIQAGVHTKLKRKPLAEDIYKWKKNMAAGDIWKFEAVAFKELAAKGYEVRRYHEQNLFHQAGRYIYLLTGILMSAVYNLYHSIISPAVKKNMRNNRLYNNIRSIVRQA